MKLMSKRITISKKLIVSTILIIIVSILPISVLAKYLSNVKTKEEIVLQNFDVALKYGSAVSSSGIDTATGTVTMDIVDYPNFSLSVDYTGDGKAYVRVKIEEAWIVDESGNEETRIALAPADYQLAAGIVSQDGYLYKQGYVSGSQEIPFVNSVNITGVTLYDDSGTPISATSADRVRLSVRLEAVQYNRAKKLWDLTTLP